MEIQSTIYNYSIRVWSYSEWSSAIYSVIYTQKGNTNNYLNTRKSSCETPILDWNILRLFHDTVSCSLYSVENSLPIRNVTFNQLWAKRQSTLGVCRTLKLQEESHMRKWTTRMCIGCHIFVQPWLHFNENLARNDHFLMVSGVVLSYLVLIWGGCYSLKFY